MHLIDEWCIKDLPKRKKIGIALLGVSGMMFLITLGEHLLGIDPGVATSSSIQLLAVAVISVIVVIVLHEGLHGLFFWVFGGKVRFGASFRTGMGPAFWASSPGGLFSKNQFQIIGLAPQLLTMLLLLLLTFASLPNILAYPILLGAAFNVGVGCLDIFTIFLLRRYPKGVLVEDTKDGLRIWEGGIPRKSPASLVD